ncbi:MAG: hypothetical protein ABSB35_00600 [Bryobacteraceae bacterium]|jgi:hypothetical protein
MAERNQIYSRLSGRKRSLSGYTQLWLGANHILLVNSTHFAEVYRHFALSDIQAIVVTSLAERTVLQVIGALAAIAWTSAVLVVDSIFLKIFFAATGTCALAVVIADIVRGPRCMCYLQTAVSQERLAPVSRLRQAERFLTRIQPAIEAVQGSLAPDHLTAELPVFAKSVGTPPEVQPPRGYGAEVLFALMLANSLLVFLDQRFPDTEASSVLLVSMLAEFVLALLVLIRVGTYLRSAKGAARTAGPSGELIAPRSVLRDFDRRLVPSLALIALFCIAWDAVGLLRGVGQWGMEVWAAAQQGKPVMATFSWSRSRPEAWFAELWRLGVGLTGLAALYFERKGTRQ